ncbi:cation diffusion facilitator family transporter [Streptomyces lydicamycinicus]|uniref:cation diffusion facilitator family transporter n=1 Tax=Streptomyces lydicamycinicus TaxID=1546107 RepID=UPI002036233D|nr:cation diffusion facilitator family transporter [Streptomyces lydicamycinicus]USA04244.1 cation diffusion facilitator family transporter [Streptomyces lydicamycinicus]
MSRHADAAPHSTGRPDRQDGKDAEDARTAVTVFVALGANLVIALAKLAGGLFARSPALLSEAAHSVADSLNELFLLASLKRSTRAPDSRHPFGYGKERYFWSLLAAVGIFVMGGCFSFFQGIEALRSHHSETFTGYAVGLVVLAVALVAEGSSLVRALLQVRGRARQAGHSMREAVRTADDPALRTVLAEDSTACFGVLVAMAGLGLHMITGEVQWEAWASMIIGALLVFVAYQLAKESRGQIIGEAADPALRRALRTFLEEQPEIDTVTTLLTMRLGTRSTLIAARVDLVGGLDSEEVEEVLVRVKAAVREQWPIADQVFLDVTEATPRDRERARRERRQLDESVSAGGEGPGAKPPEDQG